MCFNLIHSTIVGDFSVEVHLFSFRTQKLRSTAAKILTWKRVGKIVHCQHSIGGAHLKCAPLFFNLMLALLLAIFMIAIAMAVGLKYNYLSLT